MRAMRAVRSCHNVMFPHSDLRFVGALGAVVSASRLHKDLGSLDSFALIENHAD